jgi:hypothetical protein
MIELVEPEGFQTRPAGMIQFPDGNVMLKKPNGRWDFDDSRYPHLLSKYENQGWRRWSPPVPKRIYKDEAERIAIERPLSIGEILKMCEAEHQKLRVSGGVLQRKGVHGGDPSRQLEAHLQIRRIEIRNFLERLQEAPWKEV